MGRARYVIFDGLPKCLRCGRKRPATNLINKRYVCFSCKKEIEELEAELKSKEDKNAAPVHK